MKKGERENTANAYLRPVMDRPNLHISINTHATKVEWNVDITFSVNEEFLKYPTLLSIPLLLGY
jgi:hypothetical protein